MSQATFPILQANVTDDRLPTAWRRPTSSPTSKRPSAPSINVAILGIGNHRVPNYELPSNIPGLTFSDPIAKAQELSDPAAARPTTWSSP
ncbi:MAG: hypothetical protein MZV64_23895 [Ignavibacteriales bacterium]|nr:hypothetical protein [Ignavibacteriales bacterium]